MHRTLIDWADYRVGNSRIPSGDYILIYCPGHPHAKSKGHVYEHRYVMEKLLGRFLDSCEHVHHLDGNGSNNSPNNLQILEGHEHAIEHLRLDPEKNRKGAEALRAHARGRRLPRMPIECACGCGQIFPNRDSKARLRKFLPGHGTRGKHWSWRKPVE